MAKGSGGKIIAILLLVVVLLSVGGFVTYRILVQAGFIDRWDGYDKLVDRVQSAEERAETAEDHADQVASERDRLLAERDRVHPAALWGLVVAALLLALMGYLTLGVGGGANITLDQAINVAQERVSRTVHGGWEHVDRRPDGVNTYTNILHRTGQVVEGDIDTLWFVITFVKDYYPGEFHNPPHASCFSMVIRSNDATRQQSVMAGNGVTLFDDLKIRLQRSPQPTELAGALREAAGVQQISNILGVDDR